MQIVGELENGSLTLTELLVPCLKFNGCWPSDLKLYPSFWRSRLRQGRGIGAGASYRPWLQVRDQGSRGTSHVVFGIKSGRRHHFLSDYELLYFYLVERRRRTCWIKEQWPILDLPGTLRLCAEIGVRHPYCRGFPEPVTVDFVSGEQSEYGEEHALAVAVKSPADAKDPRVLRQLGVQETWCTSHGLPWALADMSAIRDVRTTLESLKFIRWWFRLGTDQPAQSDVERFSNAFLNRYRKEATLDELIATTAQSLHLRPQSAIHIFRYAAWCSEIPVDVQSPIQLNYPLGLLHE